MRTEILTGSLLKIGKLGSHNLRFDDPSVSRLHAEIEVKSPNELVDLGSEQGTFVNHEPIMRAKLHSGDRVRFGEIECVVTVAGQAPRHANAQSSSRAAQPARRLPDINAEVDRGYGKVLQVIGLFDTAVIGYGQLHESEPGDFTIGFGCEADCVVNEGVLPTHGAFPLAEVTESGSMLVHVPDQVRGEVMLDGKIFDIDGLRSAGRMTRGRVPKSSTLALPMRARCRLNIGD